MNRETNVAADTVRLSVKAVPGSSRNCIAGWLGETLRVRVTAPPEKGKANAAVQKTIAAALGLPVSATSIVKGRTSAYKIVEVAGVSAQDVRELLKG